MKFVAIADTHQRHGQIDVPNGDVLLVAGDVCLSGGIQELVTAMRWLKSLPHDHKIMIAGNHDICLEQFPETCQEIVQAAGVTYLFGSHTFVGNYKIWGGPWTPEFANWAFNVERGPKLAAIWKKIPDDTDILLTHGPPYGSGDMVYQGGIGINKGDKELAKAIARVQPKYHVFGHIHEGYGLYDDGPITCINASCVNMDYNCLNDPVVFELD